MSVRRQPGAQAGAPRDEKLFAILKMCRQMSAERDLATLLDFVAREATRLMNADRASILLLDREKRRLWTPVALGIAPIEFDARLGIAGAVALSGHPINVADAQNDSRFYGGIDTRVGYRTRSVLAVPLRNYAGDILGTFEVLNKKGGAFTTADEETLQTLATHAATAIETAQLVGQMRQQRDQLQAENRQLWKEVETRFSTQNIIGTSEQVQHIVRAIEQLRDSVVTILITGESGTGKELVAKAIHYQSPRAHQPMVALNCAALPESLVESELFGIERGVATGVERRIGKFEEADGGTLFLDEIGDLSLTAQAKILRVLQERVLERVGGRKTIRVDVRILAATNKNLESEIRKNTFREDLYYRLKVVHLHMPALRDIRDDIPLLANHFLAQYCREQHKEPKTLSSEARRCLMAYPWPGNVRELENEIKQLVALTRRKVVTEEGLSEALRAYGNRGGIPRDLPISSLKEAVEALEKHLILEALRAQQHNQQHAAQRLGISRQGLIKKMKRYGITASS